jgi:hypothetical protein
LSLKCSNHTKQRERESRYTVMTRSIAAGFFGGAVLSDDGVG